MQRNDRAETEAQGSPSGGRMVHRRRTLHLRKRGEDHARDAGLERIESADHTAITGLPLIALTTILRDLGYPLP